MDSGTTSGRGNLKKRARALFPPSDTDQYELFDNSIFVAALLFFGYVFSQPTPVAAEALRGPFMLAPQWVWGLAVGSTALVGAVCSYRRDLYAVGRRLTIVATVFWGGSFVAGVFVWQAPGRGLLSALIYLWAFSRLCRTDPEL